MDKKAKELIASNSYKEIRQDLLDQIDRNGTVGKYYADLVEDYMSLWVTKSMLVADINERGVSVTYNNGGGQSGRKKNDSVGELVKVNAQMLKILPEMGINPSQAGGGDDEGL